MRISETEPGKLINRNIATNLIEIARDWLRLRTKLQNFKGNDANFPEYENIQEEMAYSRKILEHDAWSYGFKTVNEMIKYCQEFLKNNARG